MSDTLTRVSTGAGGQGNDQSSFTSTSVDGTKIAFYTWATNMAMGDAADDDTFVKGFATGALTQTDIRMNDGHSSSAPSISAGGSKITFVSSSDSFARCFAVGWIVRTLATVALAFAWPSMPVQAMAPEGSWKKSCSNWEVDTTKKVVKGNCGNGSWPSSKRHSTLIRYDLCSGDIWNDHGHLKCDRLPQYSWGIPPSADKTCMNGFTVDGYHYAKCRQKSSAWKWTSTSAVAQCNSAVNLDGNLSCSTEYAQGVPAPWDPQSQPFQLCDYSSTGKSNVSVVARTPQDAINQYKQTLPDGVFHHVVSGPCL